MLGKCIKNEFINRASQVLAILVGILAFSGVMRGVTVLRPVIDNRFFNGFVGVMACVFVIAMIAAVVVIVMFPCLDFRTRFFKDQGYLTHTLPVKTSTLIVARMICDIAMVTLLALVYPLCICIATGSFEFFGDLIDMVNKFLSLGGNAVERSILVADGILLVIGLWLGTLFSIWTVNAAYSFGHAFTKGKRAMSIVFLVALEVLYYLIVVGVSQILEKTGLMDQLNHAINAIDTPAGTVLVIYMVMDIVALIGVAILAAATSWTCKHKLNLE